MRCITIRVISIFIMSLFFVTVKANAAFYTDPNTYVDTQSFDENYLYYESALWLHTIPADFDPVSAKIDLNIYVVNFSQTGTLDLFSSNTNSFDYGGVYTAPSKPGYIGNLRGIADYYEWDKVSFSLDAGQLDWLGDDGQIHLALIGPGYYMTDFSAQFYLESATLTATKAAVPILPGFFLLGSGLIGIAAFRKKFKNTELS